MSKIVTTGKLLKDQVVVEYSETDKDGTVSDNKHNGKSEPHKDLKDAFEKLTPHIALIGEFISANDIPNIKKVPKKIVEKFRVNGFNLKMDKDGERIAGVMLSGQKQLSTGKMLGINPPMERNTGGGEEGEGYVFIDDLITNIGICQAELVLYVEGKHAPKAQQELFVAEEEK